MKLKLLAAACSLVIGGHAFALTPAVTDAATTVHLYGSGSSAAGRVIVSLAASDCQSGTADYYQYSGDTSNVWGVSCTISSTGGGGSSGLAGKNVFFAYNSQQGSAYGSYSVAKELVNGTPVLNTAQASAVQQIQLASVSSACGAGVTSTAPNPGLTYTCTATAPQWSDAGITDTEAKLLNQPVNQPAAFAGHPVTAAEAAPVTSQVIFQQIFGIAVSQALYNDLQAAQVASGQIASGGVPSLSKSAVANYLAGSFQGPSGSGFGWEPLFAPGTVPALASNPSNAVNICTRSAGSGTKSGANAFFLNNPCGGGDAAQPATAGQSIPGQFVVTESGSTGGVKTCLTAAGTSQYAIGIVGRDNSLGANSQWVAIDGVFPSQANAKAGLYDWYVESWMEWNPTYLSHFKTLPAGTSSANVIAYLSDMATRGGSPAIMSLYTPTQQQGVMAIDDGSTNIYNDPSNALNKTFVSRMTKGGDTCSVSQWLN
jgi:hypothetical protein